MPPRGSRAPGGTRTRWGVGGVMRALEVMESRLQRGFHVLGRALGRRWAVAVPFLVLVVYMGLGATGLSDPLQRATETDIWRLWVHRGTRVVEEMEFAENDKKFPKSRLSSFLIETKDADGTIFDEKVLEEIEDLHAWLRDFEYDHYGTSDSSNLAGRGEDGNSVAPSPLLANVKLDNICRRGLNEEAAQPCFMYSVLDCFKEGQTLVHGQENNTLYHGNPYNNRPSFRNFNFEERITRGYLNDNCMQWGNVRTNWKVILPQNKMDFRANEEDDRAVLQSKVRSTHLILGALHEDSLSQQGIPFTTWLPKLEGDTRDVMSCEKVNPDCNECAAQANVYVALDWKCSVEDGVDQHPYCCGNMTQHVANHQCVQELFQMPTIASFGTKVFRSCGIPLVSSSSSTCDATPDPASGRRSLFADPAGKYPADSDVQCTQAALTPPLVKCIAGASEACCTGLDDALAGTTAAASANCMCVESVHQGVLDNIETMGLGVDWEGIIDECKASFGATLSYFGEAGGTCPQPPTASAIGTYPADSDVQCTQVALTPPLVKCIAGASEACCTGLDDALAGTTAAASANCMCVESVHQGVLDNIETMGLGVDWEGIIDECKARFGATLSYFGEAGGTCPAPPGDKADETSSSDPMGVRFTITLSGLVGADLTPGTPALKNFFEIISKMIGKGVDDLRVVGTQLDKARRSILATGLSVIVEVYAGNTADAESLKAAISENIIAKPDIVLGELLAVEPPLPVTSVDFVSQPQTKQLDNAWWGAAGASSDDGDESSTSCNFSAGQCSVCDDNGDCSGCMHCSEDSCAWDGFFMYGRTCTNKQQFDIPKYEIKGWALSKTEMKQLVDGWEEAWERALEEKAADYKHINVYYMSSSSISKVLDEASKGQPTLMGIGFGLLLLYVVAYFSFCRDGKGSWKIWHRAPGPSVSVAAVMTIVCATVVTFGVAALVGDTTNENAPKLNPLTFQILPFLTLGLGINDFFIMAKHLEQTMGEEPKLGAQETLARTLGNSGAAITMSSLAVIGACISQELRPGGQVPAVQNFAFQVVLAVVFNYLVAVLVIPFILFLDVERVRAGRLDPLCRFLQCMSSMSLFGPLKADSACEENAGDSQERELQQGIEAQESTPFSRLESLVRLPALRCSVLALLLAFTAICAWGASRVQIGLKASEISEEGSQLYDFATRIESDFQTYPVSLYTKEIDYSDLDVLSNIRASQFAFVNDVSYADKDYKESSWLYYYMEWTEGAYCSGNMCQDDTRFIFDPFRKDTDICAGREEPCADLCAAHCPQHPDTEALERCSLSDDGRKCFCPWRAVYTPEKFTETLDDFLEGSTQGEIAKTFLAIERSWSGEPKIVGASTVAFLERMGETDERTRAIKESRATLDAQDVDIFAYSGPIFGLGEQYLHIQRDLFIQIGLALATVLVVMSPLIVHPGAAVAVIFALLAIEVQVYGILFFAGMRLNAVTLMNLMMAVGFGVEFCAHYTRSFMLAPGDRVDRSLAALREIGPPIVNGGITTFLSILPVAFSGYKYFITYFFGFYSILIVVCLANALVLLPALLSFVGPAPYGPVGTEADRGSAAEGSPAEQVREP